MSDRVRLIIFNKHADSVSLRFKNSDQDWLPEYKQVDRGPKRLYYSQIASGRRLFTLWFIHAYNKNANARTSHCMQKGGLGLEYKIKRN